MTNKLLFRPVKDSDLAYIINSWMLTGRHTDRHSYMTNDDYGDYFKHHIIQLLARSNTYVRIIYLDEDEDYVLGFMVYGFDVRGHLVIHHIQARKEFWRMGLARKLIADVYPDTSKPIVITQFSKLLPPFLKKFPNLSYNPYCVLAPRKEAA